MLNHQQIAQMVVSKASAAATLRWHTIQSFFGRRLRTDSAVPLGPQAWREPHAPGFGPKQNELFTSTHFEIDFNEDPALYDYKIDRAAWMLEASVRDRMRHVKKGDQIVPPAIVCGPGERIYAVPLCGIADHLTQPIRVASRMHDGSTTMRVDYEIMLAVAKESEQIENCAVRVFASCGQVVLDALSVRPDLQTMSGGGVLMDHHFKTHLTAVVVGIGDTAERVKQFGADLVREIKGRGGSTAGGSEDPTDPPKEPNGDAT